MENIKSINSTENKESIFINFVLRGGDVKKSFKIINQLKKAKKQIIITSSIF